MRILKESEDLDRELGLNSNANETPLEEKYSIKEQEILKEEY